MKVCYFGTYRESYSRNQMMVAGLRSNGVIVLECHESLWHGIEDRVNTASGGWKQPRFWLRIIRVYWNLIRKYFRTPDHDILIAGYPGQLDVYLARVLAWIRHKPLVWDVFMSIYLIALERGLQTGNKLSIRLIHFVEGLALKLPNLLIIDTSEYVNWFYQNYKIKPSRFRLVPTGADDRIFTPGPDMKKDNRYFKVLYAGTFIPNHGVKYIVEAAEKLQDELEITFELIGEGPDLEPAQDYATKHEIKNIQFFRWMEKDKLSEHLRQADLCLGAFGETPQSLMTVQNKIYESLAMRKALISGDSAAVRQVCSHLENIYLCERASGSELAKAIVFLWKNPLLLKQIAENGYELFVENYTLQKNGMRFKRHLCELISCES